MPTSTTSTRESTSDRLFDFLIERQTALYETLRASSDRYNRFNHSLIDGIRQSSQDWTEVGKRWASRPTDIIGLWEAASDAWGNGQQRTLALMREWLEDRVEVQRENTEALRRSIGEVRDVVERVQASAPEFLRRGLRRTNGREEPAVTEA
jgi:hypothetical protein